MTQQRKTVGLKPISIDQALMRYGRLLFSKYRFEFAKVPQQLFEKSSFATVRGGFAADEIKDLAIFEAIIANRSHAVCLVFEINGNDAPSYDLGFEESDAFSR